MNRNLWDNINNSYQTKRTGILEGRKERMKQKLYLKNQEPKIPQIQ